MTKHYFREYRVSRVTYGNTIVTHTFGTVWAVDGLAFWCPLVRTGSHDGRAWSIRTPKSTPYKKIYSMQKYYSITVINYSTIRSVPPPFFGGSTSRMGGETIAIRSWRNRWLRGE